MFIAAWTFWGCVFTMTQTVDAQDVVIKTKFKKNTEIQWKILKKPQREANKILSRIKDRSVTSYMLQIKKKGK